MYVTAQPSKRDKAGGTERRRILWNLPQRSR